MDRDNYNAIITRYLEKFAYTNGDKPEEYFKWDAIACFQKYWDINAESLFDSFSKAIAKTDVLLDGGHSAPSSGIKALLKIPEEVENVRGAFRQLFMPEENLSKRDLLVDHFVRDVNARIKKYWPNDSYKPQTIRSALCYLALANPKQNFFYMYKKAENWANYTEYGFDTGSGDSFSLPVYYKMCEELVSEIKADPRLQKCNEARMEKAGVTIDDDYHTLAYDIIYCATTYNMYIDIPTYQVKGVKERVIRANEREELSILFEDTVKTEKELNVFEASIVVPPELVGQAVKHSKFGEGTILSLDGYKLVAKFGQDEKTFVYPVVFANKSLVLTSPDVMARLCENQRAKDQLDKLKTAAKNAERRI